MEKVFEIYIKATPERVWEAITSPEMRAKFTFGAWVESTFANGSAYAATTPDKSFTIFDGENIEVDPPRKLVQTFNAKWGEDVRTEGTSRVTWEIEQVQDSCLVTVTHDNMREGANQQIYGGWPMVLSGLKTLLETGELLTTPGSIAYASGGGGKPDWID